jgi:hypothetical protein
MSKDKEIIDFAFNRGELVFLLTDPFQYERMVVGYRIDGNLGVMYELRFSDEEPTVHYQYEITREKGIAFSDN